MNTDTPTPLTDALELTLTTWTIADLNSAMEHARTLERELAAEKSARAEADKGNMIAHKALRRRAEHAEAKCLEYEEAARVAADETCTRGEQHCTCVPLLRAKLAHAQDKANSIGQDDVLSALTRLLNALEHLPDCDVNDINPDGIVKPCNCHAPISL